MVDRDVPFDALATLGCAVVTGVGAVLTAGRVPRGACVAVIGAGGVGLNVMQGAVIAGAARIIAVDRREPPLQLARTFGATDVVQAPGSMNESIRELTSGRGADFVFDTVGTPATLTDALAAARKGGTVVLTGLSRLDAIGPVADVPIRDAGEAAHRIRLRLGPSDGGHRRGWSAGIVEGRLKLKELVSRTYSLDEINEALSALADAEGARGVILR